MEAKPKDLKLTPEQQKAVMDAMATVTEVVSNVIAGITEAVMPIVNAYNALPEELKQELAKAQVQQHLKESLQIMPPIVKTAAVKSDKQEYMHGVDVDSKGTVNVYHFSDCEEGENCALFKYISDRDDLPIRRPKSGTQDYWVTKDAAGAFVFKKQSTRKEPKT